MIKVAKKSRITALKVIIYYDIGAQINTGAAASGGAKGYTVRMGKG